MLTFVRVDTPKGAFAVPVDRVTEVRAATELRELPEPRPGVAGLIQRAGNTITVLSLLGSEGRHIVLVDGDDAVPFGLLVDEVTDVRPVDDAALGPAPAGQEREMIQGVLTSEDGIVLVLDVEAVGRWLSS